MNETPGFYFYGHELRYEGASPLRLSCSQCGKSHNYKLRDVIVRPGEEDLAIWGRTAGSSSRNQTTAV